mmetsp:Transcript_23731/g.65860  ORF Transcript_23731/g.65860 Transcript_23731/m.65860 type:complete len:220 (+) Transcript_23731:651-1310(+)
MPHSLRVSRAEASSRSRSRSRSFLESLAGVGLCSPLDPLEDYHIHVDNGVYFPGETVSGTLTLVTNKEFPCKAVHLDIVGRGSARHVPRNKDEGKKSKKSLTGFDVGQHRERYYAYERTTLWGRVFRTPTIRGGGQTAYFGPPWSTNEGVLVLPVPKQGRRQIVFRVMDEDWGPDEADDFLGEVHVWRMRSGKCQTILAALHGVSVASLWVGRAYTARM